MYKLQFAALAVGSFLFFLGIHLQIMFFENDDRTGLNTYWKKFLACLDGETLMEFSCYLIGWSCIVEEP